MLTESFIASTAAPEKQGINIAAGIYVHEFQPIPALKSTFKKSATNANCLAVSSSHVFAAQADKAVINVYSRERNNQEAIVPFPERVHSITLAGESDGAGVLCLGTEGGRLILWELATGRQVSTPQHHLQPTTCLAADPTSNFILSGSKDSTIHVWSIANLLSFLVSPANQFGGNVTFSPQRSFANHRAAISAVVIGHSFSKSNIAISTSNDSNCFVWNYFNGDILHTFLLSANPLCLALDPADRAVYVGYGDGSVQCVDFYRQDGLLHPIYDSALQSIPTQPPDSSRWLAPEHSQSPVLSLQVSYDGTSLLSGHLDGKIHTWDAAGSKYGKQLADFSAPVTNLKMLKPSGFPNARNPTIKLHSVVKPRYESFANGKQGGSGNVIPINYSFTAQFISDLPLLDSNSNDNFEEVLTYSSFPASLLDETLADFHAWQNRSATDPDSSTLTDLRTQNDSLSSNLEAATKRTRVALADIHALEKENWKRQKDEEIKATRKKRRRLRQMKDAETFRKHEMGEAMETEVKGTEIAEQEDGDLSSSTDELTDSD